MHNLPTSDFLLSPVDLTIHQDWAPVLEQAQQLIPRSKIQNSGIEPYGNSTFYHIGMMGSVSHHHISENWHMVVGNWTKKYLKWINTMLHDMEELEPVYGLSIMIGSGAEHTDYDNVPTALNYPIATTNAVTYVKYNDQEFTYPSWANRPWILNTQFPHGVRNDQTLRVVFNLHFAKKYPIVKQWFDARPGLTYGN